MELNQITQANLLDILFDGRNKSYGAYELRKAYNRRLVKAILIMLSSCLLLIFGDILAGKIDPPKATRGQIEGPILQIEAVHPIEKPFALPPRLSHPRPPQRMAMIINVVPRITRDADVKRDDIPPTQIQLDQAKIGTVAQQGPADDGMAPTPQSDGAAKGLLDKPKQKEGSDDGIMPVEIESSYIGGTNAWLRFLTKTIRYPQGAVDSNMAGTVLVQFVVDKEGMVTDVEAISGPVELRAEAVRAIRNSQGKWNPGIQNGRKVKSYKRQPIVFSLDNGG